MFPLICFAQAASISYLSVSIFCTHRNPKLGLENAVVGSSRTSTPNKCVSPSGENEYRSIFSRVSPSATVGLHNNSITCDGLLVISYCILRYVIQYMFVFGCHCPGRALWHTGQNGNSFSHKRIFIFSYLISIAQLFLETLYSILNMLDA